MSIAARLTHFRAMLTACAGRIECRTRAITPRCRARTLALHALPVVIALIALAPHSAPAQAVLPTGFTDTLVVAGFDFPVGMARLPDGRLLVIEQFSAKVRLIAGGALSTTDPVCTIDNVNASGGEQGLLGIAIDPHWPSSPYVYVHCDEIAPANTIRISRYTASGVLTWNGIGSSALTIDPASRRDLINSLPDAASNHNGGTLRFGGDGMLYDSMGEDAQACLAQDDSTLHGVILRLDVTRLPSTPGGPPALDVITPPDNPQIASPNVLTRLIWAWGLRNPFRFEIDPSDGTLFIGDVGEAKYEEIDHATRGGLDFGWPIFEGPKVHTLTCDSTAALVAPIAWYDRTGFANGAAVICAGPYRAPANAAYAFPSGYAGDVFFSDYYEGFMRRLHFNGVNWALAASVPGQPSATDWGEGMEAVSDYFVAPDGALWYCRQAVNFQAGSGEVRRIIAQGGGGGGGGNPAPAVRFDPPWPQPANGAANLHYTLGVAARVDLAIYDVRGRRVRTLLAGVEQSAGSYPSAWDGLDDDGRRAPAGLYLVRLSAAGIESAHRIVLLR